MKKLIFMLGVLALGSSCQKESVDEIITTEKLKNEITLTNRATENPPWIYVLDVRYSRTCATGPGVCFKAEDGEIWNHDYKIVDEVPKVIEDTHKDPDIGGMYLTLEGDKVHMVFAEKIESDVLVIQEDVYLPREMFKSQIEDGVVIKAGEYKINYEKYNKYGETWVSMLAPLKEIVACEVSLGHRADGSGGLVTPADVLKFKVKLPTYWYNWVINANSCSSLYTRPTGGATIKVHEFVQDLGNNEVLYSNGLPTYITLSGQTSLDYDMMFEVDGTWSNYCANQGTYLNSFTPTQLDNFFGGGCHHVDEITHNIHPCNVDVRLINRSSNGMLITPADELEFTVVSQTPVTNASCTYLYARLPNGTVTQAFPLKNISGNTLKFGNGMPTYITMNGNAPLNYQMIIKEFDATNISCTNPSAYFNGYTSAQLDAIFNADGCQH